MADTFTLSGNVATLPGVPFVSGTSSSQVEVFVVASEPTITDTETNVTRLGTFKTVVDVDGSFTAAGLPSTADTAYMPDGFSYRIAVRYRDAVTGSERRYESNWFALTADTAFADVVNVALTSIDRETFESLTEVRDETVAAKVAAQAAAASASQLATSDGQTAANVTSGTQTRAAVTAVVAPFAATEAAKVAQPPVEGWLGQIAKAKTGAFRVLSLGTSIQTFESAPWRICCETLRTEFGATDLNVSWAGLWNGTEGTVQGWRAQKYSGPYTQRRVGDNTATARREIFYGDRIVIGFSREADSVAVDQLIDDVVVMQSPAAGAQNLLILQTFVVSPGSHTVTIQPPTGAGNVYPVVCFGYTSTRTGFESINSTYGGTALGGFTVVPSAPGGGTFATSIPTVGDAGIDAVFAIPEVDAIHIGYVVNDAGTSPQGAGPSDPTSWFQTAYKPTMDKIVARTKAARIPLLITIEMAGHYALPNDNGNTKNKPTFDAIADYLRGLKVNNHVTVFDHQAATIMTDLAAYMARYYSATGTLNPTTGGTFSGDFIHATQDKPGPRIGTDLLHKQLSLLTPARFTAREVQDDRRRTLRPSEGRDVALTTAGVRKKYPAAAGIAIQALSPYTFRRVPVMRDPSPVNLATAWEAALVTPTGTDEWGAYKDMANQTQTLPGSVNWAGGATRLLVVRGSGNLSIRAQSNAQLFDPSGVIIPRTDTVNGRTEVRLTSPTVGEAPVVMCVRVGASASGNLLDLSGRIYEAYMLDTDLPVLLKDAATGAQGKPGDIGPAGGSTSLVLSGYYSSPTISGPSTTGSLVLNDLSMVPFVPSSDCTIDQLGIEVTTLQATTAIRLGVYAPAANGLPGALLVEGPTTIDTSSVGWKKSTLTTGLALVGGTRYWLGAVAQGSTAPAVRAVNVGFLPAVVSLDNALSGAAGFRKTNVTGALPAAYDTTVTSSSQAAIAPFIRVRVV